MLKQEARRVARAARVEAWGNVWRWGNTRNCPSHPPLQSRKSVPIWTQTGETKAFSSLPSSTHLPGISSPLAASSWQPVLGGQDTWGADRERGPRPPATSPTQSRTSLSTPTAGLTQDWHHAHPPRTSLSVSPGIGSRDLMKEMDCQ